MKDLKAFQILSDIAWDLTPVANNVRMSSMLVIKNEIISIGSATMKSHPYQKRFGKTEQSIFLHAEINSIQKALRRISVDDLSSSTLFICRVKMFSTQCYTNVKHYHHKKYPGYGLARPCSGCFRALVEFGIKRVVYTLDNELLTWEEL